MMFVQIFFGAALTLSGLATIYTALAPAGEKKAEPSKPAPNAPAPAPAPEPAKAA